MDEHSLQEELKKTRQELLLLYEIGNLIRTTLLLDEVTYLILSAVTSHEGMGYNRAILFMVDESGTTLEGRMGIGPTHPETSPIVWKMIEQNRITLVGLLDVYHKANKNIDVELNDIVRQVRLPIEKLFGILPKTIINDQPALISSEEANHELCDPHLIDLGIDQFAVLPLRGKEQVIGVLMVDNVSTKKEITQSDLRSLMMLGNQAGLAIDNAKSYSEVVVTSQQDSLTKLWNHGHFQKLLQDSLKDAKRLDKDLSLILFDIDDFKSFNDNFGHQAGDRALEQVSTVAKSMMRRLDYLARYGGEEFAAVLPGTSKKEALKFAERLREIIEKETSKALPFPVKRKISVSVGVATYSEDAQDKEKLIFCADGALYEAKRRGKNIVEGYRKPLQEVI